MAIVEKEKALDVVRQMVADGQVSQEVAEKYFPELKESENKRMIQYFKDLAPFDNADELYEKYGFSHKDAIAWLEKQCEHANFRNKIQIGDKVTRNEDGVLVNLSQLNRVAKKQGEQKPAEWSEEDEEIYRKCICAMRASACGFPEEEKFVEQVDNWFKSLKDRVQPKQEWSEEDEKIHQLYSDELYALCRRNGLCRRKKQLYYSPTSKRLAQIPQKQSAATTTTAVEAE